jgi:hypothetical protein
MLGCVACGDCGGCGWNKPPQAQPQLQPQPAPHPAARLSFWESGDGPALSLSKRRNPGRRIGGQVAHQRRGAADCGDIAAQYQSHCCPNIIRNGDKLLLRNQTTKIAISLRGSDRGDHARLYYDRGFARLCSVCPRLYGKDTRSNIRLQLHRRLLRTRSRLSVGGTT